MSRLIEGTECSIVAGMASPSRASAPGRTPCMSGALAQQHVGYAKDRYGAAAVERALGSLTKADRDALAEASPLSWVSIALVQRFHEAFALAVGRSIEETHAEIVQEGSRRVFDTMWKMLLRVGGASLVVSRAPIVFARTYDTGVLASRDVDERGGVFVLTEWPDVSDFVIRGLRVGIVVALERAGRTKVTMTAKRAPHGAIFTARWDA